MIIKQDIEITWNKINKKHYVEKGYKFSNYGDTFNISFKDLPSNSIIRVEALCDYCNEKYETRYCNYLQSINNKYCNKACCKKCNLLKQKEVNMEKYGVDSTNKLEDVKNKKRKKLQLPIDEVRKLFKDKGYIMIGEYINSNTPIEYICLKHKHEGIKKISVGHLKSGKGCKSCFCESIKGENHYNWNGGITTLNIYLRDRLREWVFDSLKYYNFKCDISDSKENLVVHHIHNFSDIVKETLGNLNLPIKNKLNQYTDDEINKIREECIRLHYQYGFGVVLTKSIHNEFHAKYGKKNNTYDQYMEFKQHKLNKFVEVE